MSSATAPALKLNNGVAMPALGLGVFQSPPEDTSLRRAQVVLRRHLEHGFCAIPTSVKPRRIAENVDVFDFSLEAEEVAAIDALDRGERGGPDPETLSPESYPKVVDNS